jgi:hypothetical protein
MFYDPSFWYWVVGSSVYSSAAKAAVSANDPDYLAWQERGGVAPSLADAKKLDAYLLSVGLPASGLAPVDLIAYAANKRWRVETGGIVVGGAHIDTSRDSQAMIANAYAYVTASGSSSIAFKADSGWVTLDPATVKAIALSVGAHVQSCFAIEQTVDAAILAGTISTTAEIDAAAWPT